MYIGLIGAALFAMILIVRWKRAQRPNITRDRGARNAGTEPTRQQPTETNSLIQGPDVGVAPSNVITCDEGGMNRVDKANDLLTEILIFDSPIAYMDDCKDLSILMDAMSEDELRAFCLANSDDPRRTKEIKHFIQCRNASRQT
jgi:hypothetical protein